MKYQRKKGTIHMVCIVYRTFLVICECDTEELGVGRTCECPVWFSVSDLLFVNCFFSFLNALLIFLGPIAYVDSAQLNFVSQVALSL